MEDRNIVHDIPEKVVRVRRSLSINAKSEIESESKIGV